MIVKMKKSSSVLLLFASTLTLSLFTTQESVSADTKLDTYTSHGMVLNNYGAHTSRKRAKKMTPVYGNYNVFNHSHLTYFIYTKNKYYRGIWKSAVKLLDKSPYIKLTATRNRDTANLVLGNQKYAPNHSNFLGLTRRDIQNNYQTFAESQVYTNVAKSYHYSRAETVLASAHELGHGLGLAHSPLKTSLMYYKVRDNKPTKPDYNAIKYLYKNKPANGIIIHHMSSLF